MIAGGIANGFSSLYGNWFRSYGNENWDFDERGLMRRRLASINDLPICESGRKYRWEGSHAYIELDPQAMPAHIFQLRG